MAFGMMLPQAFSGYLTTYMGYANFFLFSFLASIPGIITIFFLPLKSMDKVGAKAS
jgi:PAT family beta-lactamase induction signal transducer AmpG